jgi:hypothetical protein
MPVKSLLKWLFAGAIAAIAVGWIASRIHASGHAPVGLTSAGVGLLLGWLLSRFAATFAINCPWRLTVGTLLLVFVTVIAEHAWLYLDFREQWRDTRAKSAEVALFRAEEPPGPAEYFSREWYPMLWGSDAVIIGAVALVIVVWWRPGERRPGPAADAKGA